MGSYPRKIRFAVWPVLLVTLSPAARTSAQAPDGLPPEAARQAAHAQALASIGRSGLRSLLSASGNLGDLQNRVGSYRMAVQLERARTGPIRGRIEALEAALARPDLPPEVRADLIRQCEEALAELASIPRYVADYRTVTGQMEALLPAGFLGRRPLFLLVRGRFHRRWGEADGLTVLSEAVSVGPVLVGSPRWIVSPGLALGRTDVDIGPFDGRRSATSVGPRLDVGHILGERWSAAAQIAYAWSGGDSKIVRPGPDGPQEVTSDTRSTTASAKIELRGRFDVSGPGETGLAVLPRIGAFLVSSHSPPVTNNLGETGVGPFGERETIAAVRAGTSLSMAIGRWSPSLYVGWERELTSRMTTLVDDPAALLVQVGVGGAWGRGRRLGVDYTLVRGTSGLRRVSEITVVLILDGAWRLR